MAHLQGGDGMEMYLDVLMLLNFGVDLLLLWGSNRLSGYPPGGIRPLLAAVIGGLYAGGCVLPGWGFLAGVYWRIVILGVMSIIAFGLNTGTLRRGLLFVVLSIALEGIVMVIGRGDAWSVVIAAVILGSMCLVGIGGNAGKTEYATVFIRHKEKKIHMTALIDTGNTLKDPVTGSGVLVADAGTAKELLRLDQKELQHPIETISRGKCPGLRLIPYCAVGQPSGMLLGLKVEELRINGKKSDQIVAFAPHSIGHGGGYQALTGGAI